MREIYFIRINFKNDLVSFIVIQTAYPIKRRDKIFFTISKESDIGALYRLVNMPPRISRIRYFLFFFAKSRSPIKISIFRFLAFFSSDN